MPITSMPCCCSGHATFAKLCCKSACCQPGCIASALADKGPVRMSTVQTYIQTVRFSTRALSHDRFCRWDGMLQQRRACAFRLRGAQGLWQQRRRALGGSVRPLQAATAAAEAAARQGTVVTAAGSRAAMAGGATKCTAAARAVAVRGAAASARSNTAWATLGSSAKAGGAAAGSSQPLMLEAWLRRAARWDSASKGGALVGLAQDLERVPVGEVVAGSARAVRAVEVALERACVCEGVRLPPFLGVFTRAFELHPNLMDRAQQSQRFVQNVRALLEQAVACEATYLIPQQGSQVADAQQRLGIGVPEFWQHFVVAMPYLDGRGVANVYHSYATLVSQKNVPADAGLSAQIERMAATTARGGSCACAWAC
jgi:hypothetical protein